MKQIKRTQEEIDEQMNAACESFDSGWSRYPGMTYEDGIRAVYNWFIGHIDDPPLELERT